MISFAEHAPENRPRLHLQPRPVRLTQHWLQGGLLVPPAAAPLASLELRQDGIAAFTGIMRPGPLDTFHHGKKEFADGLWAGNVVELFLGNPRNGRYLEVHLAPTAQWWACVFTAVRVRENAEGRPLPLSVVQHHREKSGRRWQGSVQFPASVVCRLLDAKDFLSLRANLTAISRPLTGPAGFFSLAALPGDRPDFHQPDAWLEME